MLSGRSLSRQIAVSTLYSLDFNNQLNEEVDLSIFPGMSEEEMKALNEDEVIFARYLITGVLENLEHLDKLISTYSIKRPIEKINIVDRNILRISFFSFLSLKFLTSSSVNLIISSLHSTCCKSVDELLVCKDIQYKDRYYRYRCTCKHYVPFSCCVYRILHLDNRNGKRLDLRRED